MNIWKSQNWKKYYLDRSVRGGIKIDFDKDVHAEVRLAIKNMISWLRKEYRFPVRLRIYVKKSVFVKARDGDMVPDLFFWPYNRDDEPYIKIATGDYIDLKKRLGQDDALATILIALTEEITHYFQWLNGLDFEDASLSKQSKLYGKRIMRTYFETIEHL